MFSFEEAGFHDDFVRLANEDMDALEARLREAIKDKRIPGAQIELTFYRSRPALVSKAVSRTRARHAQGDYQAPGLKLDVRERGFGAHSNDAEYVFILLRHQTRRLRQGGVRAAS